MVGVVILTIVDAMRSLALSPQRATIRWSWSMTLRTEDCRCPEWRYGAPRGVRDLLARSMLASPHSNHEAAVSRWS